MAKYVTEVLKEINDDPSLLQSTYQKQGDGGPLGLIFKHAFQSNMKFKLPEGTPPFKKSAEPMGMTPAQFITETKKFRYFIKEDITQLKREQLFVQMLESIHPEEAAILVAIKDQTLTKLYPRITPFRLKQAGYIDPAFISKFEDTEEKNEPKPRGRPRKDGLPAGSKPESEETEETS